MPASPERRSGRRLVPGFAGLLVCAALALTATGGKSRVPQVASSLTPAEAQAKAAMAPAASGWFSAAGTRLPYLRDGQGDVVVILPDSAEGLDSWRGQVAALGDRFLAVAYLRSGPAAPGHRRRARIPTLGVGGPRPVTARSPCSVRAGLFR